MKREFILKANEIYNEADLEAIAGLLEKCHNLESETAQVWVEVVAFGTVLKNIIKCLETINLTNPEEQCLIYKTLLKSQKILTTVENFFRKQRRVGLMDAETRKHIKLSKDAGLIVEELRAETSMCRVAEIVDKIENIELARMVIKRFVYGRL